METKPVEQIENDTHFNRGLYLGGLIGTILAGTVGLCVGAYLGHNDGRKDSINEMSQRQTEHIQPLAERTNIQIDSRFPSGTFRSAPFLGDLPSYDESLPVEITVENSYRDPFERGDQK